MLDRGPAMSSRDRFYHWLTFGTGDFAQLNSIFDTNLTLVGAVPGPDNPSGRELFVAKDGFSCQTAVLTPPEREHAER